MQILNFTSTFRLCSYIRIVACTLKCLNEEFICLYEKLICLYAYTRSFYAYMQV